MLEQALSVAVVKAKIAGLVVAAAAVGGLAAVTISGPSSFLPSSSDATVTSTSSPEATESPEATSSPAAARAATTTATTASPAACPAGVTNHGTYVSSVGRDKTTRGKAHGQAVSAAAHADCGKSSGTTSGVQATETESPDPVESAEPVETKSSSAMTPTHQPKPSDATKPGKGRH